MVTLIKGGVAVFKENLREKNFKQLLGSRDATNNVVNIILPINRGLCELMVS